VQVVAVQNAPLPLAPFIVALIPFRQADVIVLQVEPELTTA
jgi:hypothetical protein